MIAGSAAARHSRFHLVTGYGTGSFSCNGEREYRDGFGTRAAGIAVSGKKNGT